MVIDLKLAILVLSGSKSVRSQWKLAVLVTNTDLINTVDIGRSRMRAGDQYSWIRCQRHLQRLVVRPNLALISIVWCTLLWSGFESMEQVIASVNTLTQIFAI